MTSNLVTPMLAIEVRPLTHERSELAIKFTHGMSADEMNTLHRKLNELLLSSAPECDDNSPACCGGIDTPTGHIHTPTCPESAMLDAACGKYAGETRADAIQLLREGIEAYDANDFPPRGWIRRARAALKTTCEPPSALEESFQIVESMIEFAYEQGFHEVGFNPLKVIRKEIERLSVTPDVGGESP